jgi:hypothetical protein
MHVRRSDRMIERIALHVRLTDKVINRITPSGAAFGQTNLADALEDTNPEAFLG